MTLYDSFWLVRSDALPLYVVVMDWICVLGTAMNSFHSIVVVF